MNRYEPNSLSLTTAKIKCVLSFFGTVILGRVYGRNVAKRAFLNDVTQIKTFFDPPVKHCPMPYALVSQYAHDVIYGPEGDSSMLNFELRFTILNILSSSDHW